jgi:hypothetical protein
MALLEALVTFTEGVLISQEILEELEPRKPVPVCSSRMLVLHGIPKHLKTDYVKKVIQTTLDKIGGIYMTELFVPVMDLFKVRPRIHNRKVLCHLSNTFFPYFTQTPKLSNHKTLYFVQKVHSV